MTFLWQVLPKIHLLPIPLLLIHLSVPVLIILSGGGGGGGGGSSSSGDLSGSGGSGGGSGVGGGTIGGVASLFYFGGQITYTARCNDSQYTLAIINGYGGIGAGGAGTSVSRSLHSSWYTNDSYSCK